MGDRTPYVQAGAEDSAEDERRRSCYGPSSPLNIQLNLKKIGVYTFHGTKSFAPVLSGGWPILRDDCAMDNGDL